MTIADEIKQSIKMDDLFRAYGLVPNRAGFVICPFHSEKTASLKAYADNTRFKCFGCGAQGDVISFVMLMHNINYPQAILRIKDDFFLHPYEPNTLGTREYRQMSSEKLRDERRKAEAEHELAELCELHRQLWKIYLYRRPKTMDEPLDEYFILALQNLDWLEYEIMCRMSEMR